jgi:hypothetical protein
MRPAQPACLLRLRVTCACHDGPARPRQLSTYYWLYCSHWPVCFRTGKPTPELWTACRLDTLSIGLRVPLGHIQTKTPCHFRQAKLAHARVGLTTEYEKLALQGPSSPHTPQYSRIHSSIPNCIHFFMHSTLSFLRMCVCDFSDRAQSIRGLLIHNVTNYRQVS